jgi:hypothetical protein
LLSSFDEYPIHQTAQPVAHPASGDPNHYDRAWLSGFIPGELQFSLAMGLYPNRGVIDGAFSVVADGVQQSVFASGRAPGDPATTQVGPLRVEVVEPLRSVRLIVDAPDLGVGADLVFQGRTAPHEEPRQTYSSDNRLIMDMTRFTQWGRWTGELQLGGDRVPIAADTPGIRDRSWGSRPLGGGPITAPDQRLAGITFLWCPLEFEDRCLHHMILATPQHQWFESTAAVPLDGTEPIDAVRPLRGRCDPRWSEDGRRCESATLQIDDGEAGDTFELEPLSTFWMSGLGYGHPEWPHGRWHDELAVGHETHKIADLHAENPWLTHVQHVVRATGPAGTGTGILELRRPLPGS